MKGIILAGGEGLKLRPMTSKLPKQMLSICGRPLMAHMISLFKRHGITEIAVVLGFLPREIQEYFGDGSAFGVKLTYIADGNAENASAACGCREFLGTDTAFLVRGTVFCDFNTSEAYSFHKKHHADVTVLLSKPENPTEYEQVVMQNDGKIERVWDKLQWGQASCETVNSGIYLVESEVFEDISTDNNFNFSHDFLALMLDKKRRLFGKAFDGYWCCVRDTQSYLRCMRDCLDEKADFDPSAPVIRQGVRSWIPINNAYKLYKPCYIGKNVRIEHGAVIGPYAQIADNTIIESGAVVQNSAVSGRIGAHSVLYGAIVCEDAVIENGAGLSEGCVIGGGARIGEGAIIFENVHIFPGKRIEAGAHVRFNVQPNEVTHFSFSDIAPKYLMDFGAALASQGKMIALSHDGSSTACAVLGALETGIRCMGSDAILCDCRFAAAAAFMSKLLKADFSVFVNKDRKIEVFDKNGLPITGHMQKMLERYVKNANSNGFPNIGRAGTLTGADEIYEASKIQTYPAGTLCMVFQHNESGKCLANVLRRSGVEIREKRRFGEACFNISDNGFQLFAKDEKNTSIDFRHMLAIGVLCALKRGEVRPIMVWDDLPHALDDIIKDWGGKIIKANVQSAFDTVDNLNYLSMDGISCMAEVLSFMEKEELTLEETMTALPDFHVTESEIPLDIEKSELLSELNHYMSNINRTEKNAEDGVTVCFDGGWVVVRPSVFRRAVRIVSEAYSMEASEEMCQKIEEKVKKLNNKGKLIQ